VPPASSATPKAGKATFISTCGVRHRLGAAKTVGTIGPDLDKVKLAETAIIKAIENGGASVMSKSAVAKYPTRMTAYKAVLSATPIRNVARSSTPLLTRLRRRD
jgi:mono/diheme cytochrome c family protein